MRYKILLKSILTQFDVNILYDATKYTLVPQYTKSHFNNTSVHIFKY